MRNFLDRIRDDLGFRCKFNVLRRYRLSPNHRTWSHALSMRKGIISDCILLVTMDLLLSLSAHATQIQTNSCMFLTRLLGIEANWETVALETYRDILNSLGDVGIRKNLLEGILKSGNPYKVPAGLSTQSESLAGVLAEFHELVSTRPEADSSFAERLLSEISILIKATENLDHKIVEVQKKSNRAWGRSINNWHADIKPLKKFNSWHVGRDDTALEYLHFRQLGGLSLKHRFPESLSPRYEQVNPLTGDYYFSTQAGWKQKDDDINFYRVRLFSRLGKPLPKIKASGIKLLKAPSDSAIAQVEVSADGKRVGIRYANNKILHFPASETRKTEIKPDYLITHSSQDIRKFGFLDSNRIFYSTTTELFIKNLDRSDSLVPIPINRDGKVAHISNDGNRMLYLIPEEKKASQLLVYDTSPEQAGNQAKLLHTVTLEAGKIPKKEKVLVVQEVVLMPDNPYLIEIYSRLYYKDITELRIIDPKNSEILYREKIPYDLSLGDLKVSSDGKFLQMHTNENGTAYTLEWSLEYLKSLVP